MKKYLLGLCLALMVVTAMPVAARAETTTDLNSMLTLLQNLMKQVETLQSQLAALKGDIREEIRAGLKEGMEDEDVKKIQELLATDPTLYPKGLVSGYYGPLTKEAIERFQARYALTVTGEVDEETRELMAELFKERVNGKFPPGLLKAPGIEKKIKDRLHKGDDGKWTLKCDDKRAAGPLCKKDKDYQKSTSTASTTVSTTTAATAIEAAEDAIDDLKEAIDDATDEDGIEDAEEELAKAEKELADAEDNFDDGDNKGAYDDAVKAKSIALKAIKELAEAEAGPEMANAEDAIEEAEDAIDDLKDAIEDATDDDAIDIAEAELEKAEEKLDDANDLFDVKNYDDAQTAAEEAEELADDATTELEQA
jgi:HEPN domain-containing protein